MSEEPLRLIPLPGLTLLDGTQAMVCEGDSCELPPHFEAHVVTQRLDDDRV